MPLTKTQLTDKINDYLETRWRSLTRQIPKYSYDEDGNQSIDYITIRNDETLDEDYNTVPSEVDALLTAIVSSTADAIIELIKSEGIDIGDSEATKMDVG